MGDHASAGSDWQAQAAAGQQEFSKGMATGQGCMMKGAGDMQKAFSGRRRRRRSVSSQSSAESNLLQDLTHRNRR